MMEEMVRRDGAFASAAAAAAEHQDARADKDEGPPLKARVVPDGIKMTLKQFNKPQDRTPALVDLADVVSITIVPWSTR
jgi:hypothetical protein